MPIIFGGIRPCAVLGAIKGQLPLSERKYQLLNTWNKISLPQETITYLIVSWLPIIYLSFAFSATASEQIK